jgi:hypothetical protein
MSYNGFSVYYISHDGIECEIRVFSETHAINVEEILDADIGEDKIS